MNYECWQAACVIYAHTNKDLSVCLILTQSLFSIKTQKCPIPGHATLRCLMCRLCCKQKPPLCQQALNRAQLPLPFLHFTGKAWAFQQHWFTGVYRHYFLPLTDCVPSIFSIRLCPPCARRLAFYFFNWACLTQPGSRWRMEPTTHFESRFSFSFFHSLPRVEQRHHGSTGSERPTSVSAACCLFVGLFSVALGGGHAGREADKNNKANRLNKKMRYNKI